MAEEYMTTSEVAERLRLSEETIRRWCRTGRLPSVQIGRAHRIPLQAVLDLTPGTRAALTSSAGSALEPLPRGALSSSAGSAPEPLPRQALDESAGPALKPLPRRADDEEPRQPPRPLPKPRVIGGSW